MKTFKLEITHATLDFSFRDIAERGERSREAYDAGNLDGSATQARLMADSVNELACLLTQIARTMEAEQQYMNKETGSVDTYDGWHYVNGNGESVNAVDLAEAIPVKFDTKTLTWVEE